MFVFSAAESQVIEWNVDCRFPGRYTGQRCPERKPGPIGGPWSASQAAIDSMIT